MTNEDNGTAGNEVFTISATLPSEKAKESEKYTAELEEALDIVGLGWCNVGYCMLYAGFLISVILETTGYSYVLPAGKCDLGMSDEQRGLLSSLPYIAVVITSHLWGYLADTCGRRSMLLISAFGAGILGATALFMPDLVSFAVVKMAASLFLACPASISYALIGEMLPRRFRDTSLSIVNASQILGSSMIPLLGWLIIRWDFRVDFGLYVFRPWRLLGMVYSLSFVLCGLFLLLTPESPKFLVAKGRLDEALVVLQKMYAANKGKRPEDFPISAIRAPPAEADTEEKISVMASLKKQTLPLFQSPYLKWMCLNSFLLFGIMSTLNGLFIWVPDVLNRVLSGSTGEGKVACEIIGARLNASDGMQEYICNDYIETSTFQINSIANTVAAMISLLAGVSVQFVGKKALLIIIYTVVGAACVSINFATSTALVAVLMASLQLPAIGIGSVNAYSVGIFPTELRGMAVGLSLMFGRCGSALGTNAAGILINASCEATFFGFGGLLLLCAVLSLLLPGADSVKKI